MIREKRPTVGLDQQVRAEQVAAVFGAEVEAQPVSAG